MSTYSVHTSTVDRTGQSVISDRVVIYADTELEAKVAGAAQLGVSSDAVIVQALGDTGMAPNAQIIGRQN